MDNQKNKQQRPAPMPQPNMPAGMPVQMPQPNMQGQMQLGMQLQQARTYPSRQSTSMNPNISQEGQMEREYLKLLLADYMRKQKLNSPIPDANIEQNKDVILR